MDAASQLDVHRKALSTCRRCGLGDAVRPIVSLARAPRAMLVGQAPGRVECEGGRPFSGRAGGTLFRWLARAGLDEVSARQRVYIAAITRCYPGASASGRGDRVPSRAERSNCAEWLERELCLIRPRLIIPVGKLAIARFLEPLPLEELVGRQHQVRHAGGMSIAIPLPHPSGASSWVHQGDHASLLGRALELLADHFKRLGIVSQPGSRSVA